MPLTIPTLLLLVLLGGACGNEATSAPDATPDPVETCLASDQGGAAFPMRVGWSEDGGFVEMSDGQEVELVRGYQGLIMLVFDVTAETDMDGVEEVCFQCEVAVDSPTAAFSDASFTQMSRFTWTPDGLYQTEAILILADDPIRYEGASAHMTARCDGHERSGAVERTITLSVPTE